jgi:hypothetical protein
MQFFQLIILYYLHRYFPLPFNKEQILSCVLQLNESMACSNEHRFNLLCYPKLFSVCVIVAGGTDWDDAPFVPFAPSIIINEYMSSSCNSSIVCTDSSAPLLCYRTSRSCRVWILLLPMREPIFASIFRQLVWIFRSSIEILAKEMCVFVWSERLEEVNKGIKRVFF